MKTAPHYLLLAVACGVLATVSVSGSGLINTNCGYVTWDSPNSVSAGATYQVKIWYLGNGYIPVYPELTLFKNGSYAGSDYRYDCATVGGLFEDHVVGTISYAFEAIEWADDIRLFDCGYPPVQQGFSVQITAPNSPPAIAWENLPGTVYAGQSFTVRARATDIDGNLSRIYMELNGSPHRNEGFASGLTGSGSNAYLDSQAITAGAPGSTYFFTAKAHDQTAGESPVISHAVVVANRAPSLSVSVSGTIVTEGQTKDFSVHAGYPLTLNFSASDPDGNYQCTRMWMSTDGGSSWQESYNSTAATGTFSITPLVSGTWQFQARSLDSLGAESGTVTIVAVCPGDILPPSVPGSLALTAIASGSATVTWAPSTDNIGVTGYQILRDSVVDGATTAGNMIETTSRAGIRTTYTYNKRRQIIKRIVWDGTTAAQTSQVFHDDAGNVLYTEDPRRNWVDYTHTPFRWHGTLGVTTESNGLVHMRARFYHPRIMRFLNADPIGFEGGMNWFAFVGNNPIIRTDPLGLWQFTIGAAYGIGARLTFGKNEGQWNFSIVPGIGIGVAGSYNPNDNRVGRVNEGTLAIGGKPILKDIEMADSIGIRLLAEGGLTKAINANASLLINLQAGQDTWLGMTVEGGVGVGVGDEKLAGFGAAAGGSAWAGIKWDPNWKATPDLGAAATGAQFALGELALVGIDMGVSWRSKKPETTQAPSQTITLPSLFTVSPSISRGLK